MDACKLILQGQMLASCIIGLFKSVHSVIKIPTFRRDSHVPFLREYEIATARFVSFTAPTSERLGDLTVPDRSHAYDNERCSSKAVVDSSTPGQGDVEYQLACSFFMSRNL